MRPVRSHDELEAMSEFAKSIEHRFRRINIFDHEIDPSKTSSDFLFVFVYNNTIRDVPEFWKALGKANIPIFIILNDSSTEKDDETIAMCYKYIEDYGINGVIVEDRQLKDIDKSYAEVIEASRQLIASRRSREV